MRRPAAFSADPERPGSRCYRSGDLGHIDAAGSLHLAGRKGNQVTVRGHPVATMEIESALCACPGVMRAAVPARSTEVPARPVRLVAYVVAGRDANRDPPLLLLDPPDRLLAGGYSQRPGGQFVKKMKQRSALGRTAGPVDDPGYMHAVIRVAMAFEQAIADYRPRTCDGPAHMPCSRQRLPGADANVLRQIFSAAAG